MKLITNEIRKNLPAIGSTDNMDANEVKIHIKFFTPDANWTWYVTEGQEEGDDFLFFGLVDGLEKELGYFSLKQLENVRGPLGLEIERDLYFGEHTLDEFYPYA